MIKNIELRKNGFEIKANNRRVRVVRRKPDGEGHIDEGVKGFTIEIKRLVGDAEVNPTCSYSRERGIAITALALTDEILEAISIGFLEFRKLEEQL